jgi:hypothetical protein
MAVIRLYRKFYRIVYNLSGNTYSLINPTSLSAAVYIKDTSNLVETVTSINKVSDGIYYVDLTPNYYSYSDTYDLKWTVKYSINAPFKILITSFKLNPININGSEVCIELENQEINTNIETQIININIES